ncbi:hypothetical protein ET33_31340 [Paenibacillus tyrfis]|uniref:Uncharacterized protein n=1 Tax=Paenibacillus tyrfis TaxID=1501230 RepID=A0A081P6P0_9BACL|nr:hypothetical protein ET33_31340 [Paenibacillus tyrfis]
MIYIQINIYIVIMVVCHRIDGYLGDFNWSSFFLFVNNHGGVHQRVPARTVDRGIIDMSMSEKRAVIYSGTAKMG